MTTSRTPQEKLTDKVEVKAILSMRKLPPHLSPFQSALAQVNTYNALACGQAALVAALDPSQTTVVASANRLLSISQDNLSARERALEVLRRKSLQ